MFTESIDRTGCRGFTLYAVSNGFTLLTLDYIFYAPLESVKMETTACVGIRTDSLLSSLRIGIADPRSALPSGRKGHIY